MSGQPNGGFGLPGQGPTEPSGVLPRPPLDAAPTLRAARSPIVAVILNLSGVSAGYVYLGLVRRAMAHAVLTIALFVTAFASNAARHPGAWRVIFAGWIAWMAVDGWRQGRRLLSDPAATSRRHLAVAGGAAGLLLAVAFPPPPPPPPPRPSPFPPPPRRT
jgi:hypothetical protein